MPGGWEYQPNITPYEYQVFYTAVRDMQEYFYYPVAVAIQVVNGINYRFMTIADPRDPNLSTHFAVVEIYQPIDGEPYVTKITPV